MGPVGIRYGPDRQQTGDLSWTGQGQGPVPAVMFLHGGLWQARSRRDLMTRLASAASGRGWATWNVEYRRTGHRGARVIWPASLEDAAKALDHLSTIEGIDADRVAVVGHEAGGQLAAWLASRPNLPAGAPGTPPKIQPRVAVCLAGLTDLVEAFEEGLGHGAVGEFAGGTPDEVPERYAQASPAALVPPACPVVLIHGEADTVVPVSQSKRYLTAARAAGDRQSSLVVLEGVGHHELLDPDGEAWGQAAAALTRALTPPRMAYRPPTG